MLSNPWDKILNRLKTMAKICPIVFLLSSFYWHGLESNELFLENYDTISEKSNYQIANAIKFKLTLTLTQDSSV